MEILFEKWLSEHTKLTYSSCEKYVRAIRAISKDMKEIGILDCDLYNITNASTFQSIEKLIKDNDNFSIKDKKGNRMYSVAMRHYLDFLLSK